MVFFVGTNTADIETDSRRIDKAKQDKNLGILSGLLSNILNTMAKIVFQETYIIRT